MAAPSMSYNANYGDTAGGGRGGNPYASYHSDSNPPGQGRRHESNPAAAVQSQIDEVVDIMQENINSMVKRGEDLNMVQDKSDRLRDDTQLFRQSANNVRKKMWWKNMKWKIFIAAAIVVIILVIVLSVVLSKK
ncbi:Vesicle membrane receptor protein (v-SNARE) [Coemansia helicoidea]|uniref:Vesicle membrane receptor protein (V-SNARE) n=1 Tax=Coemansia helicoidea TaxID=1286919 RepID=A0ACC1L4I5_9FUNG|nr:Vesicle membrane receptor protein (v-SNARE) [Coemansia helicoidea]